MAGYLPCRRRERAGHTPPMGLSGLDDLYGTFRSRSRLTAPLNLPAPQSELEVRRTMESLADQNLRFRTVLRGAGAERPLHPRCGQSHRLLTRSLSPPIRPIRRRSARGCSSPFSSSRPWSVS